MRSFVVRVPIYLGCRGMLGIILATGAGALSMTLSGDVLFAS